MCHGRCWNETQCVRTWSSTSACTLPSTPPGQGSALLTFPPFFFFSSPLHSQEFYTCNPPEKIVVCPHLERLSFCVFPILLQILFFPFCILHQNTSLPLSSHRQGTGLAPSLSSLTTSPPETLFSQKVQSSRPTVLSPTSLTPPHTQLSRNSSPYVLVLSKNIKCSLL